MKKHRLAFVGAGRVADVHYAALLIVVTSNLWGVALGEWKQKPGFQFRQMLAGSSMLVLATFLVAQGR